MRRAVLAIDPGPEESAYAVWDGQRISDFGKLPNADIWLRARMARDSVDRCCIEMIASYGMAVGKTVFETCVWIGRFMEAFGPERCDRITRNEVKSHLCHSPKARDANIRQALIDRLGEPGTKRAPGATYGVSKDVWAAVAVGVTWWDQRAAEAELS
jgi:hypothetical protein